MQDPTPATHQPKLALSKQEVSSTLGVSISYINALLASGELPHRKAGRRVLIPRAAVVAFLEGK